ncbi:MAG: HAD family hydrolase [Patescibacteria group bacterium]
MIRPETFTGSKIDKITAIELVSRARSQEVREALARENYNPEQIVAENKEILNRLSETPFRVIGQKLSKGEHFTFEEAFLGMTYVVSATNRGIFEQLQPQLTRAHSLIKVNQEELRPPAQAFLTSMAQREAHDSLTAEEVAGMVAAGMMDINLRLGFNPYVLETAGMGGDKGFAVNGEKKKVINASTLSAIVLSSMDVPVVKHGSYANTSAVGSTEAIEALGVNIYQSSFEEIEKLFKETNFYFSDAHIAKTIHDLSHSPFMRHETINHIIGPMTPPIDRKTRLNKVIGVNEGVYPSLIAKAYEILHQKGHQEVGNVVVVSGLSNDMSEDIDINKRDQIKPYMMLDEVSPYKTLLSIVQNGKYVGNFLVKPEDFGVSIDAEKIQVVNTQQELLMANGQALNGLSEANSNYLAMNAAVGLFAAEYLDREDAILGNSLNGKYLRECFTRCREAIVSGQAAAHLEKTVAVSNRTERKTENAEKSIFDDVDVVIFDIDKTLVKPRDEGFYAQYVQAVNRAVASYLDVSLERATEIANFYRQHFGGGERALFDGNLSTYFPELTGQEPNYSILYEEMCKIDPTNQFDSHSEVRESIQRLRSTGKKVVALTDSPEDLSKRVLKEAGLDPDTDFDLYLAYRPNQGPHKLMRSKEVFREVAEYFGIAPEKVLSIGDSYATDIQPAEALGMKTCFVSEKKVDEYNGLQVSGIRDILKDI